MSPPARFIMVAGFLGAGKTTALGALARRLMSQGKRIGIITNDQAPDLVDTLNLRSQGFPVEEIAGGCFCGRFNSLVEAAERLSESERPDVFLSEPVGSSSDLLATVGIPMRHLYGDRFDVAPLTVLIDPIRAKRILTNQKQGGFSPRVAYIYRKQLEEADAVAVNKADVLDASGTAEIHRILAQHYPGKRTFTFSAREAAGMEEWFNYVTTRSVDWAKTIQVDYGLHDAGEGELGWLNSVVKVSSPQPFDPNRLLTEIASRFREKAAGAGKEIAHLKMTLVSGLDSGAINVASNDAIPELSREVRGMLNEGEITVNARVHINPDTLRRWAKEATQEACAAQAVRFDIRSALAFRPSRPAPTLRMSGP
jgi:G3E family GTPase